MKSWAVEVLAPEEADYPGYGTICERSESRSPAYVNIDCVWDTTAYPNDGGTAQNRPYVVRISVQGSGRERDVRRRAQRRSPIPTTAASSSPTRCPPRDVHLAFVETTKQATIRWAPNPEPDITSYVVQERVGDGPWKNVGQAGGKVTTFTRNLSAPGTYRYQVAALRAAGSGTDTVQSAWSGPARRAEADRRGRAEAAGDDHHDDAAALLRRRAGDPGQPGAGAGRSGRPGPSPPPAPSTTRRARAPAGPPAAVGRRETAPSSRRSRPVRRAA